MDKSHARQIRRFVARLATPWLGITALLAMASCGGNENDSGANKTYLRVEAADADGDTLQYQWRATAGNIENRNARETVWTMPDGPGLHFAYVSVSDGKGGYAEQQHAVSTDALGTTPQVKAPVMRNAPQRADGGSTARLRFYLNANGDPEFALPAGSTDTEKRRRIYLPDVRVQVVDNTNTTPEVVFGGFSDTGGEVLLPQLKIGRTYSVHCATQDSPLGPCGTITGSAEVQDVIHIPIAPAPTRNLLLFGHVALADGGVCGTHSEFFGLQSAATVQLLQSGNPLTPALRVNQFGDYALDAAVMVHASLDVQVRCGSYVGTPYRVRADAAGYANTRPVEASPPIPNSRPRIVKLVANGPDGNVRGKMIVAEAGAVSSGLPGPGRFLTYKAKDTRLSACKYYEALGAVKECDTQGGMVDPITFDDWKKAHRFSPYNGSNAEISATYINRMDLNLVRRMVATRVPSGNPAAPDNIAFYVCNHPGPEGSTQREVDQVLAAGLADEKRVACVAMEWSTTPGIKGGNTAFTKFLVFAPDGSLIPSVNLDGRGEKFLPGACVACHGGSAHNGRFPDKGAPSPYLGAGFLPFDTANYLFGSIAALSEAAQNQAFFDLNQLVAATEASATSPANTLIKGWYHQGTRTTLDKSYVPTAWESQPLLYREVVATSCRTCHVALSSPRFNWDGVDPNQFRLRVQTHFCGGKSDLANNATMPNALISRDRLSQHGQANPALAELMASYLGCVTPKPDPVYPRR